MVKIRFSNNDIKKLLLIMDYNLCLCTINIVIIVGYLSRDPLAKNGENYGTL